ncbi:MULTISPECIES: TIR domain-containing protein [Trichocoleus]|uniref:TIR domain-containing protein n=1 Tax=Trichocoleus desertorum GB2-A4 TaxID=2933944 RepID=A0ABV0JEZ7_9CYAN|nr:TIR domain-containing protein [Trichocoleus sp. FACHB-46]
MVENNYRQAFKSAIARVYNKSGAVVGAGFLVADRQLLTCAHVITAALGLPTTTQEAPTDWIDFDFPLTAPGQKVKAKVTFWCPVQLQPLNSAEEGEDIAGLVLEEPPPNGCQPVRLVSSSELWAHAFQIFGFPTRRDDGIWASGVIRDRLASGWVQIEDIKAQGHPVQPGFSGAPIWDEQIEGVVGMAVAADKKRDETKTAFMIPTSVLTRAWEELGQSVQLPDAPKPDLENQTMKDFFVSYNRADKQWAEWIAWTLEEAGYSVVIQAWDFRPGGNFVLDMQRAAAESQKTIAVLSESYLKSSYTQPEWAAAFANDPQSLERKLIPVRVKECKPEGMLRPIVYTDLVGKSELEAKQTLLDGLRPSGRPPQKPAFPEIGVGKESTYNQPAITEPKSFPSALSRVQQIKEKSLQQRLDSLTADYEALAKQRDYTTNAADRNKLNRQLEAIAEDMDKVAIELDGLGK